MSKQNTEKKILKKISLHGLNPEDALKGFMATDPKKVRQAEKQERAARRRKKPHPKK